MTIIRAPLRWRIEHQSERGWHTEVVSHDECDRHTRKLWRTACGCMRYGTLKIRPKAKIYTVNGMTTETNIARLFVTMSADQPLQGSDYACHVCDDEHCVHPDHLYVGTHMSNARDKFRSRRIRERRAERFFDQLLIETLANQPCPLPEVHYSTSIPRSPSGVCLRRAKRNDPDWSPTASI